MSQAERVLASCPTWFAPRPVVELLARLAATILRSVRPRGIQGLEARARGFFSSPRFGARGLRIGRGIEVEPSSTVILGDDVSLTGDVYLNGVPPRGRIEIGRGTRIDRRSVLYGEGGIRIGCRCAVAAGVIIYSQTNRYDLLPGKPVLGQGTHYAEVRIGDDVWIGAGAIILPGVVVGNGAVIGAGAVVREEVAPRQVVAGVPARVIATRR